MALIRICSRLYQGSISENKLDSVPLIEDYLENLRDLKLFVMDLINRVTLMNIDTETVKEILTTYGEHMEVLKKNSSV